MERSERPYNEDEIKILRSKKFSFWEQIENFILKFIWVAFLCLVPLILYDKFIDKVSSETQLLILIPLLIFSIGIVFYWMKKEGRIGWNSKVEDEIKNGKAQVLKIQTEKVYKRKETFDLGSGFYIKISENETLYLQGQHFDDLQYSRKFPHTDFTIVSSKINIIGLIDIKLFGKYLKPEKKLKAFTEEQFKNEDVDYDGDLLNKSIEEIV